MIINNFKHPPHHHTSSYMIHWKIWCFSIGFSYSPFLEMQEIQGHWFQIYISYYATLGAPHGTTALEPPRSVSSRHLASLAAWATCLKRCSASAGGPQGLITDQKLSLSNVVQWLASDIRHRKTDSLCIFKSLFDHVWWSCLIPRARAIDYRWL